MSSHTPSRVSSGVPAGGQFAASARAETDVQLTAPDAPSSYARSADRPNADTWHHPGWVSRADAITAYDDDKGTYTIGDTLHVRAPYTEDSFWIDSARPVLASLRRAGLSGNVTCYATGGAEGPFRQEWRLHAQLFEDKGAVYFETHTGPEHTFVSVRGEVERYVVATEGTRDVDQDQLDAALEEVVRAGALVDTWRDEVQRSGAPRTYVASRGYLREVRDAPGRSELTISTSGMVDVVVTIEGDRVTGARSIKAGKHQPDVDREQAMATIGRAIGLLGGKRAGVPNKVEAMLAAAANTGDHPAVRQLLARREAARAA